MLPLLLLSSSLVRAEGEPFVTLSEAEERAATRAASVTVAQLAERAAEARVLQAKSAFYPSLSASTSVLVWNDAMEVSFIDSGSSSTGTLDCTLFAAPDNVLCYTLQGMIEGFSTPIEVRKQVTTSSSVRVVEPLTGLLTAREAVGAARDQADAASHGVDQAIHEARYQAADAWYLSLEAEKQQEIGRAQVKGLEARVAIAQVGMDAGVGTKNDLLQVQLALAQARQSIIQSELLTRMAWGRLGLATGTDGTPVRPAPTEDPGLRANPGTEDALVERALSHRPDLAALTAQAAAAEASARMLEIGRYPQVSAMGIYTHTTGSSFMSEPDSGYLGATADWTIWAWGRQKQGLAAAHLVADQLQAQLRGARSGVRLEVHNRLLTLEAARAALDVADTAIGQAEENVRILEKRQEAGTATMADLLDADTALVRARTNQSNTRFEGHRAEIALERAVGVPLWSKESP